MIFAVLKELCRTWNLFKNSDVISCKASHHSLLACLLSRRHFASRENLWLLSKSRPSKAILFHFLFWYLYFTMSTGVPYIGTRISLISKSEIRYEGILYTIDTKESTVTLANGTLCVWKLVPAFEQAFFWIFWNLANYDMILLSVFSAVVRDGRPKGE